MTEKDETAKKKQLVRRGRKARAHLSMEEKRDWLAGIFRDESGEISQADKFKAMIEDTRLAAAMEADAQQREVREKKETCHGGQGQLSVKEAQETIRALETLANLPPRLDL